MSDELLTRATKALRESTDDLEARDDGALTLARVERSLRTNGASAASRRRKWTRFVAMPIAAVFLVLSAWASASGRLGHWLRLSSGRDVERTIAEAPSAPEPRPTAAITPPPPAPAPASASASASASAPALARAPAPADPDALYRAAHDTHFSRHDYPAAVAAWDAYLASAGPGGRFTLEARYNRAVALVKSGRRTEARAALQPFADGEYGGYRRDEARDLLHTLD
jgi:hypothetical protein